MDRIYILEKEKPLKAVFMLSKASFISNTLTIILGIIETFIVGKYLGALGLGAMAIYMPINLVIIATTLLFTAGTGSLISRLLGAGEEEKSQEAVGNVFATIGFISVVLTVLGIIFAEPIIFFIGDNKNLDIYSMNYIRMMFLSTLFYPLTLSINSIIRAEGNNKYITHGRTIAVLVNLILDILLVGFFKFGIVALGISYLVSKLSNLLYGIYYFKFKSTIKMKVKYIKVSFNLIKDTIGIGVSSFVNQGMGSISYFLLNQLILEYGGEGYLAVYSVAYKINSFVQLFLESISFGTQPLIGYNKGKGNMERVNSIYKVAVISAFLLVLILTTLILIFSKPIVELFLNEGFLINKAVISLRIIMITAPINAIIILTMMKYRALGYAKKLFYLSLLRKTVFFIPFLYIMPMLLKNKIIGLWLVFPISNILFFLVLFYFVFIYKNKKEN